MEESAPTTDILTLLAVAGGRPAAHNVQVQSYRVRVGEEDIQHLHMPQYRGLLSMGIRCYKYAYAY